ncbi:DUF1566 domain-containing protein [Legionella yabuuchiae]|uniref:DUF1566 domain-containing protein n=1 Tax=Legionella yabuuchiae TaxID=376727 RepID=UPI0010556A59|nr:DUF1566 domain-containing protein [Legionella yabuuchiae]
MKRICTYAFAAWLLITSLPLTAAPTPKFLLTPTTATTYQLSVNDVVTVGYQVTNQTKITRTLTTKPLQGVTQVNTQPSSCPSPFTLGPNESCLLELEIRGADVAPGGIQGGPQVCKTQGPGNNSPNPFLCSQPATANQLGITVLAVPPMTSLKISTNELAIAKQGIFTAASGTGPAVSKARQLIITNIGTAVAQDVDFSISPGLPVDTDITPSSTCGNIAPGKACILTITPGTTASGAPATAPTPSVLTAQGTNTNAVTSDIIILTYGHIFKGGYVFSIDDATDIDLSVGGRVVLESDQVGNFAWGPAGVTGADSKDNGKTNTDKLGSTYPAAQQCIGLSAGGFKDWYLPAICELGYQTGNSSNSGCGTEVNPLIQNVHSNLGLEGNIPDYGFVSAYYWSSTDDGVFSAWLQNFGSGDQEIFGKSSIGIKVRCARAFTP